jgi:hypothetical protein
MVSIPKGEVAERKALGKVKIKKMKEMKWVIRSQALSD